MLHSEHTVYSCVLSCSFCYAWLFGKVFPWCLSLVSEHFGGTQRMVPSGQLGTEADTGTVPLRPVSVSWERCHLFAT